MALSLLLSSLAAWAQPEPGKPEIYADECRLGTAAGNAQPYHAVVYYPNEYAMRVPGIVIGTEKSGTDQVRRGALMARLKAAPDGIAVNDKTTRWLKELVQGGNKAMFISHVAAFDGQKGTLVFDAYRRPAQADESKLDPAVGNVPWLDCDRKPVARADAFADSWRAIKAARERISTDLDAGHFTHVFLIAMGWNTVQIEAMQNFASFARTLQATARGGQPFRPYVIGFTWPSQWDNPFLAAALVRSISLGNKANDADEFAAGWLGASLRYAVLPALDQPRQGTRPQVIAIGHSFGARAMSHAVCRGTILSPADEAGLQGSPPLGAGAVDALISLQGAYSLNRFRQGGAGLSELAYAPACPAASRLVFSASRHDAAAQAAAKIPGPLWAGSFKSWERLQQAGSKTGQDLPMSFCSARSGGQLDQLSCPPGMQARFLYVDASELIKFQSFGTGGGAHSDIYKNEVGEFVWQVLGR